MVMKNFPWYNFIVKIMGKVGKGFAVVADEIKELSTQSTDATKKIDEILEKSVESTTGIKNSTDEQVKAVDNIVMAMDIVQEGIDSLSNVLNNSNK